MATQLQGCSWDGSTTSHSSWFGSISDDLDYALGWVLMVHDATKHGLQVQSTAIVACTLSNFLGPQVTHEYTSLEGLVTWTLVRVRGRLRRATENGNIGAAMRYQQMQRWLETCLHHLPTASLQDREKTLNSLSEEHDLSEDDSLRAMGLERMNVTS